MLSNRNLAIIALVLIIGAISDGVLYNQVDHQPAIYPFNDARTIEVKYQDKVLLTLLKTDDEWQVTHPFHAPAIMSRVSLLLESNNQTNRSYSADDLKHIFGNEPAAFPDPVELSVDNNLFLLGDIEPVSQLRYVSANNKVYLQADHIVPMLQSPKSTFTNLNITKSVTSVDLVLHQTNASNTANASAADDKTAGTATATATVEQLSHWSDLDALAVIDADILEQPPIGTATITAATKHTDDTKKHFEIAHYQQLIALHPKDSKFAYLISQEQASTLGICVYC